MARNRCESPQGNFRCLHEPGARVRWHTWRSPWPSAPLQIPELVAPLRDDAQRILKERDDDEEAADRRQMRL